ncbi:hypothetical protein JWG45_07350 [Leptospira sp. 201903070]|jgi:hypothetical protein|uniref:DUF4376 domain-containing protein n=1 Tax=Leptospira ainlahdjerensis TaxID=2810033 RepID=A0ABS2U9C6_9LEPT|nr:hypothetical protein [Leptospira ainlahdjerensis]MBM9576967.1 hypothetical protein [Leptospira ainlahdjerensis]
MNYIIEKESKKVVWINSDPQRLTGKKVWNEFDSDRHEIVYALHYNPQIQETFKAVVTDGLAQEFQSKVVYDKITGHKRILQHWNDEMDSEKETEEKPLCDENGKILLHQAYTKSGWKLDLDRKKKESIEQVNQICSKKIVSGFHSNALGTLYQYESAREDQINLMESAFLESDVSYKCKNSSDENEFRIHTPEQIRKVLNDGSIRKRALLQKASELKSMIRNVVSIEELQEIDLESGWA